jgi:hypothetical protein
MISIIKYIKIMCLYNYAYKERSKTIYHNYNYVY